jgi:hypothetical protein
MLWIPKKSGLKKRFQTIPPQLIVHYHYITLVLPSYAFDAGQSGLSIIINPSQIKKAKETA